ncbi:hypothetical protein K4F52_001786 [Lecanicillium sp. MT-2017a]|nr:hypothetical protein K4F52_001786 [Lecanicillium sp. MT-2017a]
MVTPYSHPILYQALDLLGEHECTRLLGVYHQALGELHPICSVDHLKDEACRLQGATNIPDGCQEGNSHDAFEAEENDLLCLNIALAIAVTAEAASEPNAATTIYESCRDLVIAKVARTASSVKDVVVTMMMGFYYYFRGKRRLAWRMCSLAGRMAMELGLHCDNVAQQNHETEEQETQLVTISCTLLVLDRQWSAGIGLPSNFKETDFDMAQVSRVSTPYLREMMKFTLISHKFNEPISRVARGEALDEAKIEIIDFQVMQWRKRAMESHNYVHPDKWEALSPQNLPPAWMTILYLRANAVRTILIRAFFLSEVDGHVAAEKVALGLDLISESLNILSILDRKTDAYKLLHPVFQHFVASSCALLLLIIVFVKQNPNALPVESAATYAHQVHRNFEIALKLSATTLPYANTSHGCPQPSQGKMDIYLV